MSKYGYRIIKARWTDQVISSEYFEAAIEIVGIDSLGLVSKVTDIISKQLKVNMKSISFESLDGTFVGNLKVNVSDKSHLEQLMNELSGIDKYINVNRLPIEHNINE
jgi:GTP pyrophosphokinase